MFVDVLSRPQWNSRWLTGVLALFTLGLGVGLLSVGVAYRNPVLSIALVAVVASSALGVWRPRISFFLFLALLPFVDFLKRLQLAFTNPSSFEWYLVLALPDILLLSAAAGVVFKRSMTQSRLTIRVGRAEWWLLASVGAILLSIVHSASSIKVGVEVFMLGGL